jgi:hypothetical protein
VSVLATASSCEARFADSQTSLTDRVAVAMPERVACAHSHQERHQP